MVNANPRDHDINNDGHADNAPAPHVGYNVVESGTLNVARFYRRAAHDEPMEGLTAPDGAESNDHVRVLEPKGSHGLETVSTGFRRYEPLYASGSADPHAIDHSLNYKIRGTRDATD